VRGEILALPGSHAIARSGDVPRSFDQIYAEHLDFVWRSARRLGIPEAHIEDVAQDVFVVVHRRLADYDGRAPMKSWLFGIVARVARAHRRRFARKLAPCVAYDEQQENQDTSPIGEAPAHVAVERSEAVRLLDALLAELDDDKREVLVLAQIEEMSVPEIAECLGLNVNTASARLRAARRAFEEAHARHRARTAREERRLR
jgi:RNA polymerase sigma-70 factor (ECF subfamily)